MNRSKAKTCKPNRFLIVAWATFIPVAVALECLWCCPNAFVLWREHVFLPEIIILAELIVTFTLDSDGNKSASATSSSSSTLRSRVLLPSGRVCGKQDIHRSHLGDFPGEYSLSPGILKFCSFERGESGSLGASGTMETIILLLSCFCQSD